MREFITIDEMFDSESPSQGNWYYVCQICWYDTRNPFEHLVDSHGFDFRSEKGANAPDSNVMISHQRVMR